MNLKSKNVLVIGLAVTGVPLVKALCQLGANVVVNDLKKEEYLTDSISLLSNLNVNYILGKHPETIESLGHLDLVVVSPGVPLDIPFIDQIKNKGIEIIGEIELAYRLSKGHIVAITGTNGKTTTTALVGEIFKNAGRTAHVVGNIGVAFISKALETNEDDVIVIETSSFQLESIVDFQPEVGAILNLTPDHLNRHKTMENYQEAKFNLFKNQVANNIAVINYDDLTLRERSKTLSATKIYFSRKTLLKEGIFVDNQKIVLIKDGEKIDIISIDEIYIPGKHNLENALAATAIALSLNVDIEVIKHTLKTFIGVEHRIEPVDIINGVKFINDSKATNSDAAIKALEAIDTPILLLAGGLDKGTEFDDFINAFNGKVRHMFVYGETAQTLLETAKRLNFDYVTRVENLEDAVKSAYNISTNGDTILLSPACASWDMYENFEMRGKHFKEIVAQLRR
ncbi:UDP-N-acetylmuramoyl-L-alanine--D-glutamate ligase [Alkaliphilus sp. MSJ-5]|uniref:UDP-N-acetylmuramoylalanine--D-glutamate ligase n=1 Tax=Alkaliphilus flagellatus TaxID=2841507 RepID=A0ABS6G4J0_9FIRM|nr:UDP-N-acetylmuramoyl-L-alanine--D-glutamate ligase [Alkaliphilus flagellatus]MBU5677294.1 UDP-N-acetylmuramoyl-L-alanine--D-glutamate ligase [Alkaliphilus flagellatus]